MSKDGEGRYFFRSSKACRYTSDQEKSFICLKVLKNGRHLSADLEINRLSAAILPFNCYTSFFMFRCFMSMIAFIFSGLASIPRCETRNPRNFSEVTPNVYLVGFNLIWCRRSMLKASSRSQIWFEVWVLFTNMSSTYTTMFCPICALKILLMSR